MTEKTDAEMDRETAGTPKPECGICGNASDDNIHTPGEAPLHPFVEAGTLGMTAREQLRKIAKDCDCFDGECKWGHAEEFKHIAKQLREILDASQSVVDPRIAELSLANETLKDRNLELRYKVEEFERAEASE
jgi:hypothetical protein